MYLLFIAVIPTIARFAEPEAAEVARGAGLFWFFRAVQNYDV